MFKIKLFLGMFLAFAQVTLSQPHTAYPITQKSCFQSYRIGSFFDKNKLQYIYPVLSSIGFIGSACYVTKCFSLLKNPLAHNEFNMQEHIIKLKKEVAFHRLSRTCSLLCLSSYGCYKSLLNVLQNQKLQNGKSS